MFQEKDVHNLKLERTLKTINDQVHVFIFISPPYTNPAVYVCYIFLVNHMSSNSKYMYLSTSYF